MTRASSGTAPGSMTAAGDSPVGHGQTAAAGAARSGAGRRYAPRDLSALASAVAGPLAASGVLLPFRAGWSNTNVALMLVVVVVAVAAAGNRLAGALAAVGAAVWFDFFFTLPYYRLTIRSSDDVTTAVLLLVTGLAVSQLAAWARRLKVTAVTGEGYLATMHGTAALAQASRSPEAVAEHVGDLLAGLLDLQEWRFEYGSLRSHPPRLEFDGQHRRQPAHLGYREDGPAR
jgi:K+-sensing histidine kinase KdpD